MSGHSKWANIKNRKGKQDAIKGKIYTKMGKIIAIAAREGGSDPNANGKLKEAIAKAKAQKNAYDASGEVGEANISSPEFAKKTQIWILGAAREK